MQIERGLVSTELGYIHYRATGAGAPVMLFHINQQSSALMLELMQALAPRFRVVAMDYPSHGHSDPFPGQPSFADYTRCAIDVMDHLGIRAPRCWARRSAPAWRSMSPTPGRSG